MGDTSRHLTYFKVENFKRFESFEMENLGQFNLIVGDNNVGKTSVLEALLPAETGWDFLNSLFVALNYRKIKSTYSYRDLDFYYNKELNQDKLDFSINYNLTYSNEERRIYKLHFNGRTQNVSIEGIPNDSTSFRLHDKVGLNTILPIPFIPFYKGHDRDLTNFFSNEILPSRTKTKKLIDSLKILIPEIEGIQLSSPDPDDFGFLVVSQSEIDATIPLALFGDGVLKLFRLLIEILNNKGKRLMIDEVDTGIHYSRFKEFWKTILLAAKENDVQLL